MEKRQALKEGDPLAGADKNKLIESANKFIAKNQFDKAIKDLQKVLEGDPKNNQVALKIAELFLKLDKKEDATNYYEIASNIFRDSGFYDKAIAVYRQLLTINPISSQAYLKLAELFRKKNLIAEAVSNYKVAIAIYEREGRTQDALKILQTITELEPSNLPGRMKLAELYIKNGLKDQAYTELSKIAEKLIEAKRVIDLITVYERMLTIKPGEVSIVKLLIKLYLSRGDYQKVLLKVKDIIAAGKSDTEVLIALAKAYVALDKIPLAISAYKEVGKLYSKEGLESQTQDIYKKILELDPADPQALQVILGAKAEPATMREIEPEPFEITRNQVEEKQPVKKPAAAAEKQTAKPQARIPEQREEKKQEAERIPEKIPEKKIVQKPVQEAAVQPESGKKEKLSQDEIEKYFSEAQVYKRYGLHSKAIEKLNQILATNPSHRTALAELFELYELGKKYQEASQLAEKLYNILIADGEIDKAEDFVKQAIVHDPGNEVLKALIGYTPEEPEKEVRAPHRAEQPPQEKREEQPAVQSAAPPKKGKAVPEEIPVDVDIDVEMPETKKQEVPEETAVRPQEIDTDIEIEIEAPLSREENTVQETMPEPEAEQIAEEQQAAEEPPVSKVVREEPKEEVPIPEQIDFSPELEEAPGDVSAPTVEQKQEEDISFNFSDEDLEGAAQEGGTRTESGHGSAAQGHAEQEKPHIDVIDSLDEAEFYYQQGIMSEAKEILQKVLNVAPNEERARKRLAEIVAQEAKAHPAPEAEIADLDEPFIQKEAEHVVAVTSDEGLFDLAQELEKELSVSSVTSQVQQPPEEEQQVSVEEVLEAFKKGVEKSVDKEDAETHYNLGIAYKEMGLIDEAINEFGIAMLSPDKKADGLIMLGMSYMGKGLPGKAIEMYKQALDEKGGVKAENIGLLYEFAIAFEAYGDMKNAYNYFAEVKKIDEKFRDVKDKLDKLEEFVQDGLNAGQGGENKQEEKFTLDSLLKEDEEEEQQAKPPEKPADKPASVPASPKEQADVNALSGRKQAKEEPETDQSKAKPAKKRVSYI